jgi:hypothetical protein
MNEEDHLMRVAVCSLCSHKVDLASVPLLEQMMIDEGFAPVICRSCVIRKHLWIERLGAQDRIWYGGEKYLGYGDVFVGA